MASRPLSTMKILHALVGFLTVTALPFSPFAFVLPLALAASTNVTQKQDDGALRVMKHEDIIEARQLEIVDVVIIVLIVANLYADLYWISEDNPVRGNEMEFLVDHFDIKYSARNVKRLLKIVSTR